jgi:hypothetical protein
MQGDRFSPGGVSFWTDAILSLFRGQFELLERFQRLKLFEFLRDSHPNKPRYKNTTCLKRKKEKI